MTLLEVSMASALIVIVSAAMIQFSDSSWRAYGAINQSEVVNQRAWSGIEQITRKLRSAGTATNLVGANWVDEVQFRACEGFAGGTAELGVLERLAFRESPGGVDNDGDGLIDEGEVVWFPDYATAPGKAIVLCRNVPRFPNGEIPGNGIDDNGNGLVDEPGFGIRRVGDQFEMVLTVSGSAEGGHGIERTMRRTLAVRMQITGDETP